MTENGDWLSRNWVKIFFLATTMSAIALCIVAIIVAMSIPAILGAPGISSHVLDQTSGIPAAGVSVNLSILVESTKSFQLLATQKTNSDGRVDSFINGSQFVVGTYKVTFDVGPYFMTTSVGQNFFYPYIEIPFIVKDVKQHYHVPALLSPYGFSTYRGS